MKAIVLVSGAIVLTAAFGCSKQESTASAGTTAAAAAPAPAPAPATAPAPPAARAAAPAPIGTSDGPFSGVRAEVTELKRTSGGTLTLRFTIVNDSGRSLNHADVMVMPGLIDSPYTIGGVHLIDLVGKKKYFVAKDSNGACVCSSFSAVPGGDRANHWAKFPAPPEDVERISIMIPPFAPMDDVPVSR
jgi:hypothetical protein